MKVKQNICITRVTYVIVINAVIEKLYKKKPLHLMEGFCSIFRKYTNIYIHRNYRDLQNA